jgi:hypothetical protein
MLGASAKRNKPNLLSHEDADIRKRRRTAEEIRLLIFPAARVGKVRPPITCSPLNHVWLHRKLRIPSLGFSGSQYPNTDLRHLFPTASLLSLVSLALPARRDTSSNPRES